MEELTKAEERIMQALWKLKKAFVKDVIEQLSSKPTPLYTTISSVVRILARKGYVGFNAYGNTHEYFPLISKSEYRAASLKRLLTQYFDDSPTALATFLVEESLSPREKQQQLELLQRSVAAA